MNPSAIYSKSGKGVQEASGKTSLLKRADRAVLSAIDGRTTLSDVAKKVGKPFDAAFQSLIAQLDRDGFVREVAGGASAAAPAAARPAPKPAAARPAPKAAAPAPAVGEDLDFTGIMPSPLKKPQPAASGASAKPAAPAFDPNTTQRLQEEALYKARQEAEARAQEERDRLRAEAEAKARAEAEAKVRAETEKKLREEAAARARADAEAKAKAAREEALRIAAEAKAKLEAEAKARIEAERRAREEAERQAREEAEKARREAEELRQRLEEERKAREEAERKAREEAERRAREEAERRAREEAERKAREEAERKAREEAERKEAERKAKEEAERRAKEEAERRAKEEAERKAREEAERRAREEAEKAREEQEAQMRRAREDAERKRADAERKEAEARERREADTRKVEVPPPPPPAPRAAESGEGLDALMADLDSFSQRDEEERKAREQAEARARGDKERKLREEAEAREREQAEREREKAERERVEAELERAAEDERRQREQEARRAREEEERRAREEEEIAREEAEERARRAREAGAKGARSASADIGVTEDDLGMDDVRRDEAAVAKESRKARREREREARRLEKEARERDRAAARAAAKAAAKGEPLEVKVSRPRRRRSWGRPVAIFLFIVLAAGIGALHVMPVPTEPYEQAASEALRQPVRIGAARLSLYSGVQLNLSDVTIGAGTKIAELRAYPKIGALFGETKAFNRIELDGVVLRQDTLVHALSARARGPNFTVDRIVVNGLRLDGPLRVPALEADVRLGNDGAVRTVLLRGPEGLLGQVTPTDRGVDFDVTAGSFTLPFAPDVSLSSFAMKGQAGPQGMRIESWGGSALGGALSGTANLRWGRTWELDGVLTVRGINAAVFAPALLSEGNAEGSGKFSMSGVDPARLVRSGRVEGSFTIGKGVLGSFDLSRAIRSDGREVNGRTQFVELNGQGIYDRGAVALRNVIIGAGALQAGASADISQSGALSGRIVADVRTAAQSLRATLLLGGTVKDPQVRN